MNTGCRNYRRLARRDFFRVGGAGLFGLTLTDLLRSRASAAEVPARTIAPKADQMLVVWLGGGPPHQDMFDMKPDAPAEIRGEYKPVATNVNGLEVCELMPRLAQLADKYTILRSVGINSEKWEHGGGQYWLTGNPRKTNVTPNYPMYGNVVAKLRPTKKELPTFVAFGDIDNHAYGLKQNYLGPSHDPIVMNPTDPSDQARNMLVPPPGLELKDFDSRNALLKSLDSQLRGADKLDPLVSGLDKFQQTSLDLLRSPKLRQALDLDREDPRRAERYGKNSHARKVLAARRMIEAGVPFVYTHFESNWDHHGSNFKNCRTKLPNLDNAVASLIEDLDDRGLLERTIVLVLGEMGRTPKINKNAGRDHWGTCQSILVAGGGFARGKIVGATDEHAAYVVENYYKVESFGRTIYRLLGVDPDQT
ncbi:MAG: DUF1501 domain-containing protein, partial [Planctomycetales bacterium]